MTLRAENSLTNVIENALDFMTEAISEFENKPKYSVIHFHAAVELFLKARLMAEHWTLVVSKRKEPDWQKFATGDFISVSLDESSERLRKVVGSGLSKQELEIFRSITSHRNRMIHFFHEADSAAEKDQLKQAIAKEQLTAWYLLHRRLTVQWLEVFEPWKDKLNEINKRLRNLHAYLRVVFDQIEPDIKKRKLAGESFRDCASCGFQAQEYSAEVNEPYEARCLVCDFSEICLSLKCPECETAVQFVSEGFGVCSECGRKFEPKDVAEELVDDTAAHIAYKDGDDSLELGNCSDCDGYHTVVPLDEEYFCTTCFGRFRSVEWCGWCNEPNTGDMENSSWTGCNHCDGNAGWLADKDD